MPQHEYVWVIMYIYINICVYLYVCVDHVCIVGIAKHKHKTSILVVLRESTLASHLALLRPLQRHSTHSARPLTHTGAHSHTHTQAHRALLARLLATSASESVLCAVAAEI